MTTRSLRLILPLCAALAVACISEPGLGPDLRSGQRESPPPPPPQRVLTTVTVAPSGSLHIPGDTLQLTVNAWDQFGEIILDGVDGQWADKAIFLSSAPEIARVSSTGVVTAVAPGVAEITTSLTVADRKAAGWMTAMVDSLATSVTLTANQDQSWSPYYVNVKAGGIVTWIVPKGVQVGTIWLNVSGPNPEKLEFTNGVATRTFSTPGIYDYGEDGDYMWSGEGGVVQIR